MNKLTKASIAGAAGVLLLLGGAGTLAYWNDSATVQPSGSIQTGALKIEEGTGTWSDSNGVLTAAELAAYRIVPGDKLTYTEKLEVTAVGDNLTFDITTDAAELAVATDLDEVTVEETVVVSDGTADLTTLEGVPAGTYTATVTVVVDFPWDAAGNDVGNKADQGRTLNLDALDVTVTQK